MFATIMAVLIMLSGLALVACIEMLCLNMKGKKRR
jgi:hypothetical protein